MEKDKKTILEIEIFVSLLFCLFEFFFFFCYTRTRKIEIHENFGKEEIWKLWIIEILIFFFMI